MKNLSKGTIFRTIFQVLTYANQIVAIFGQSSFASAAWYQWTSVILTIIVTSVSYWYNNDWTNIAKLSGDVFDMLKDGKITEDELKTFMDKHKEGKE